MRYTQRRVHRPLIALEGETRFTLRSPLDPLDLPLLISDSMTSWRFLQFLHFLHYSSFIKPYRVPANSDSESKRHYISFSVIILKSMKYEKRSGDWGLGKALLVGNENVLENENIFFFFSKKIRLAKNFLKTPLLPLMPVYWHMAPWNWQPEYDSSRLVHLMGSNEIFAVSISSISIANSMTHNDLIQQLLGLR